MKLRPNLSIVVLLWDRFQLRKKLRANKRLKWALEKKLKPLKEREVDIRKNLRPPKSEVVQSAFRAWLPESSTRDQNHITRDSCVTRDLFEITRDKDCRTCCFSRRKLPGSFSAVFDFAFFRQFFCSF